MTKQRFAKRLACASAIAASLGVSPAPAQQTDSVPKVAKPINTGDVLSGELTAMRVRGGAKGKRVATYQITSEPRGGAPPHRRRKQQTGPEAVQLNKKND